jgi:hypothetical protein
LQNRTTHPIVRETASSEGIQPFVADTEYDFLNFALVKQNSKAIPRKNLNFKTLSVASTALTIRDRLFHEPNGITTITEEVTH